LPQAVAVSTSAAAALAVAIRVMRERRMERGPSWNGAVRRVSRGRCAVAARWWRWGDSVGWEDSEAGLSG
jgi:hypothetical protein